MKPHEPCLTYSKTIKNNSYLNNNIINTPSENNFCDGQWSPLFYFIKYHRKAYIKYSIIELTKQASRSTRRQHYNIKFDYTYILCIVCLSTSSAPRSLSAHCCSCRWISLHCDRKYSIYLIGAWSVCRSTRGPCVRLCLLFSFLRLLLCVVNDLGVLRGGRRRGPVPGLVSEGQLGVHHALLFFGRLRFNIFITRQCVRGWL